MKYLPIAAVLLSAMGLTACSNHPSNTQTSVQPDYANLHTYGVDMGCKAALQNQGTPESNWQQAPELTGTKADYIAGWKAGFEKCRIGLGPVQLPVKN